MADFGKVAENLKRRGYAVKEFATAKEAADYLNGEIDGVSVGFGGSATLDVMDCMICFPAIIPFIGTGNRIRIWHERQLCRQTYT